MTITVPIRIINGRLFDLANPTVADVDFISMARALARQNRFAGNTEIPISVAQHSLIAVECARARGNGWAAAWVLLHDFHEAWIGDITTPAAQFLAWTAQAELGDRVAFSPPHFPNQQHGMATDDAIDAVIKKMKGTLDISIYAAAGLHPPLPGSYQDHIIKQADRDAYLVELRDFHRGVAPGDPDFEAMTAIGKFMPRRQKPLSIGDAEIQLMAALREHLPCYGAPQPVYERIA